MSFNNRRQSSPTVKEFEEKVIQISRVSKKTKGGNKIGFSALMVVGDKKGRVGVALGKAPDLLSAIKKGVKKAKKRLVNVPMNGTTIPFAIEVKSLVDIAQKMLSDRESFETDLSADERDAMNQILKIGTSAGGARPKAVIAFNKTTKEVLPICGESKLEIYKGG